MGHYCMLIQYFLHDKPILIDLHTHVIDTGLFNSKQARGQSASSQTVSVSQESVLGACVYMAAQYRDVDEILKQPTYNN